MKLKMQSWLQNYHFFNNWRLSSNVTGYTNPQSLNQFMFLVKEALLSFTMRASEDSGNDQYIAKPS